MDYHANKHYFYIFNFTLFSRQFRGIQLLVITILSHRYNSRMGSGETKVESQASSETQPKQAELLLNTARLQPGSQPTHCARPATGAAGDQLDSQLQQSSSSSHHVLTES
jgi:hypothetical protein